jgi:hypothetical protein
MGCKGSVVAEASLRKCQWQVLAVRTHGTIQIRVGTDLEINAMKAETTRLVFRAF